VIEAVDTVASFASGTRTPASAKVEAGFGASEPVETSTPTDDEVKIVSAEGTA
jgi:hypothetical protein